MRKTLLLTLFFALLLSACTPPAPTAAPEPTPATAPMPTTGALVIYSGRNENLVAPLIETFKQNSGIDVQVRYGGTAEMAATILEEGENSPADLFFGQDAGALGALTAAGALAPLPADLLALTEARFRAADGSWIGVSGRARVVVYNTELVAPTDLPQTIWDLTGPQWRGKVGWAPTNASFQAFITALRLMEGEEQARAWLTAMIANEVQAYASNTAIVEAVGRGEILAGLVNHYYLFQFLAEQGESFPARNYFLPSGDAGAMINVAGAGMLKSSSHPEAALTFLRFLLSPESQDYFANQTYEYPLARESGVALNPALPALDQINAPDIELGALQDLQRSLELLQDTGALDQ